MNIALSFPGCHRRGGVERIVLECAGFLAGQGHSVDVYASEWDEEPDRGVRYHEVRVSGRPGFLRGPRYYREASRILRNASFDVMNSHGCVCPTGGVHWVQSIHAAWLDRSRAFRRALSPARIKQSVNPLHPLLLRLEAEHFRNRAYRKVIATTPEVRADLNRFYGVPESDVVIIPNGFSPVEFNPRRRAARRVAERERLGLAQDETALLFVANELDRKGYDTLLSALKLLRRRDIKALIVGRFDALEAAKRAARMGLTDQVLICGPTADVAAYHAAADVFVLPTQYEAFCLAILEALGSGLPVITTTVPGARDAIAPHVNGLLIADPKSGSQLAGALQAMLEGPALAAMSANAPGTVAGHQWPVVLERYEQVLVEHRRS